MVAHDPVCVTQQLLSLVSRAASSAELRECHPLTSSAASSDTGRTRAIESTSSPSERWPSQRAVPDSPGEECPHWRKRRACRRGPTADDSPASQSSSPHRSTDLDTERRRRSTTTCHRVSPRRRLARRDRRQDPTPRHPPDDDPAAPPPDRPTDRKAICASVFGRGRAPGQLPPRAGDAGNGV